MAVNQVPSFAKALVSLLALKQQRGQMIESGPICKCYATTPSTKSASCKGALHAPLGQPIPHAESLRTLHNDLIDIETFILHHVAQIDKVF